MLCDYFTFLANKGASDEDDEVIDRVSELMEVFCSQNNLQVKAVKEVHYLCLQLERLLHDATKHEASEEFSSAFTGKAFEQPTEEQEKLL